MPSVVMIVLGRDDIQDCLVWTPVIAIVGFIGLVTSQRLNTA